MLNYDNTAFNASIGVPVSPFLLTQTAGSPTPNLLLTLQRLYGSLWFPSIALGFPFAESTASCFIRLFNSPTSPITKENLYLTDELWESQHTGLKKKTGITFGKFFSLNLTQTEMSHMGPSRGEKCNSIALKNKTVKVGCLSRDKWVTLPPMQPFPRSTRFRASPTKGCSECPGKLAKMLITWSHPLCDAEGDPPGHPWDIFFTDLDLQARPAGRFIDTLIYFCFHYLFILSSKKHSGTSKCQTQLVIYKHYTIGMLIIYVHVFYIYIWSITNFALLELKF